MPFILTSLTKNSVGQVSTTKYNLDIMFKKEKCCLAWYHPTTSQWRLT